MSSVTGSIDRLEDVEALTFDCIGTVVNWYATVTEEVKRHGSTKAPADTDWVAFAREWRQGYLIGTYERGLVNDGDPGPSNNYDMHREVLDNILKEPKWSKLATIWDDDEREQMVLIWHYLPGWPDTTEGLYALKKEKIITTLANGSVRLFIDMAKYADLPWDAIFCGENLGSFKPNPKVYLGAAHYLGLEPSKCAMVASHIMDLRYATKVGMRTVYIRRPTEDTAEEREMTKTRKEGGEVDIVVDSFVELAEILSGK